MKILSVKIADRGRFGYQVEFISGSQICGCLPALSFYRLAECKGIDNLKNGIEQVAGGRLKKREFCQVCKKLGVEAEV